MKRFLVTGAAGFIGSHLVERLLDLNYNVIGLDNYCSSSPSNLSFIDSHKNKSNFTFIEGDIRDIDICHQACTNCDFVLHQAALGSVPRSLKHPLLYNENNITGTLNMLIAARDANVKRFVYASSSSVYGDTPILPKIETMSLSPKSPYAISKFTNEVYAKLFTDTFQLPTIGLRYFNVFGERQNPFSQYAAVIPRFATALLEGKSPVIFGDGKQTRDFTYIENVLEANINSCHAPESAFGKVFNIGGSQNISVNTLATTMAEMLNSTIKPTYENHRPGDVKDSLANTELAKTHLNYETKVTIMDGLKKTVEWHKTEHKKS